jgi:hypothetical protein
MCGNARPKQPSCRQEEQEEPVIPQMRGENRRCGIAISNFDREPHEKHAVDYSEKLEKRETSNGRLHSFVAQEFCASLSCGLMLSFFTSIQTETLRCLGDLRERGTGVFAAISECLGHECELSYLRAADVIVFLKDSGV